MDAAALNLTTQILGYGRFLFLQLDPRRVDSGLLREIEELGAELENMHYVDGPASDAASRGGRYQYLRGERSLLKVGNVADEGMSRATALIRLEGNTLAPLTAYENGLRGLIEQQGGKVYPLSGVQKPRSYTSYAMTQFAYARARSPAAGNKHQFGVVTPQNKTREWWEMDWMRRESLFLPQYDKAGNMVAKGHALASAAGIPCINRRLFHSVQGYGLDTGYDFIGYFEFAESDSQVFRDVMVGLRDRSQNPEWNYVREGPEWWGRRVGKIGELWAGK